MTDMAPPHQPGTTQSKANLSLWLGIATLAAFILTVIFIGSDDEPQWLWFISPLLGLAALITGITAREGGRFPGKAIIGMVIGVVSSVNMVAWAIAG
jgi:hypothetical protein